ncbi:MAG: hypothetical protein LUG89_00490 [Methanosphaera sp.]|nr:hypothetical protein [Methanosphaera sp.]
MNKTHFSGLIFRQYNGSRLNGAIHTHFMKKTIDIIDVDNNIIVVSEVVTL